LLKHLTRHHVYAGRGSSGSEIAGEFRSQNSGFSVWRRGSHHAPKRSSPEQPTAFFDAGARNLDELTAMFAEVTKRKPLALVVTAEPFTMEHRSRILDFMAGNVIPAMYEDGVE
jgi:hypothetical protein